MGFEINEITNVSFSTDGGQTYIPVSGAIDISDKEIEVPANTTFYKAKEASFTSTFDMNNELWKLLMKDVINNPNRYELHYVTQEQNRKHKKRRINKKWLKKYGTHPVEHVYKGLEFKNVNNNGINFTNNQAIERN